MGWDEHEARRFIGEIPSADIRSVLLEMGPSHAASALRFPYLAIGSDAKVIQ
jgi:hypothetical protein